MKKRILFLTILLLVTSILVASTGAWLKYALLEDLEIETQENIISLPFVLMADRQLRYQVSSRMEQMAETPILSNPESEPVETTEATVPAETESDSIEEETQITEPEETEPLLTEPIYVPVDESWFDDVLFIGESRTMGLQGMGRLGKADYFCARSVTVFGIQFIQAADDNFKSQSLERLLSSKTYGKVYIHLGTNELGANVDDIIVQYQKLIDLIKKYQPDCYIILQAVMPVGKSMASNPKYSLANFNELNTRIAELAVDDSFRFIDVREWIADEEGYLPDDKTGDGCHLYGYAYVEWKQWLLENAGWLGIP